MALLNLGNGEWLRGEAGPAAARLEQALGMARVHGMAWIEAMILNYLGYARVDLGDHRGGAAALHDGLRLAQSRGNQADAIDALEGLARLAAATGDATAAVRLFAAAAALREAVARPQAPTEQAVSAPVLAGVRARLGEAAAAAAWAEGWQLAPEAAMAAALAVRGAPSETGEAAAPAHGLTPRESEILRLLAEGLTNREIGDRLFISPSTAARHVANIFAKLDVDSRAKAAAFAHRHCLA